MKTNNESDCTLSKYRLLSQVMPNPRIEIRYCTKCRWMLRAAWLGQELLSTFEDSIGEVALVPGESGQFQVFANGTSVWDRKEDGGFPEAKVLKQKVRDVIDPQKDLGHSDRKPSSVEDQEKG